MNSKKLIYKGNETEYIITDTGLVYGKYWKSLKQRLCSSGYVQLCLYIKNKPKYLYLHRAVYETFVGEIPKNKEINHKDGNKLNNSLNNLELVTSKENKKHSWDIGLSYSHDPRRNDNKQRRLEKIYSVKTIKSICEDIKNGELKYIDICDKYNIKYSILKDIIKGKLWPEISEKYNFSKRKLKKKNKFAKRDKIIKELRNSGYKIKDTAKEINITFDAVARRLYLMKKCKI